MTNRGESALDSSTLFFLFTSLTQVYDESIFTERPVHCARMTEEPNVSHLVGDSVMILIDAQEL